MRRNEKEGKAEMQKRERKRETEREGECLLREKSGREKIKKTRKIMWVIKE